VSIFIDRINEFKNKNFKDVEEKYKSLAQSQKPHTLLVTCSDSRLCPHEFSLAGAGELFIIRNAGNLVPSFSAGNPSNEAVTLEYGVVALGIKEVVVCGHISCGAMTAVQNTEGLDSLPLVKTALTHYKNENRNEIEECDNLDELIEWNVKNQLASLLSYEFIKTRVKKGELSLSGIVYDFVNAEVTFETKVQKDGAVM